MRGVSKGGWVAWAMVWLLVGCGDDRTTDGGMSPADGGVDAAPSLAASPMIDWLAEGEPPVATPQMTCPAGWRTDASDDVATCAPHAGVGTADCPAGQAHFVGQTGCAPVGAACPVGDFPVEIPPSSRVIYVRAGAVGGDGSMGAPFGALASVPFGTLASGTTVVLGKGSYTGNITLRPGVRVLGACAAETIVTGASGATASVRLASAGAAAELRDVTLRRAPTRGIEVTGAGATLTVEGVVVEEATQLGLYVSTGATLDARRVAVLATREDVGREYGVGLAVDGAARVTISEAVFARNHLVTILIGAGSEVTLEDLAVIDGLPEMLDGAGGRGIDVQGGAALTLRRAYLARNRGEGLAVGTASATVEDLVVEDTGAAIGAPGLGIQVFDGATLEAQRVVVQRARGVAFVVTQDSAVTMSDVVVRDVDVDDRGENGWGIAAQRGGRVDGSRVLVARVHGIGLVALAGGAHVALDDTLVRDVATIADGTEGRAATAQFDAELTLRRSILTGLSTVAVEADGEGAYVTLEDTLVRDVGGDGMGILGMGLLSANGGQLSATRVLVDQATVGGAVSVGVGSHLALSDAVIRDTRPQVSDGAFGHGIHVQGGATLTASRVQVTRSRGVGVLAIEDATATLSDTIVEETMPLECATTTCTDSPFGYGIAAVAGGLTFERFVAREAALCGVFVGEGSSLDLRTGEVRGAEIGACIQQDDYDLGRLMNDVAYDDNVRNLEATSLPVPGQIMPFSE